LCCSQCLNAGEILLDNYYGDKINNTIEARSTAYTYYILFCADVVQIREKFIMSSRRTKRHKEKQSAKLPIKLNHIRRRNFTMYASIDIYGYCSLDRCVVERNDCSYNIIYLYIIYLYIPVSCIYYIISYGGGLWCGGEFKRNNNFKYIRIKINK